MGRRPHLGRQSRQILPLAERVLAAQPPERPVNLARVLRLSYLVRVARVAPPAQLFVPFLADLGARPRLSVVREDARRGVRQPELVVDRDQRVDRRRRRRRRRRVGGRLGRRRRWRRRRGGRQRDSAGGGGGGRRRIGRFGGGSGGGGGGGGGSAVRGERRLILQVEFGLSVVERLCIRVAALGEVAQLVRLDRQRLLIVLHELEQVEHHLQAAPGSTRRRRARSREKRPGSAVRPRGRGPPSTRGRLR